MQLSKMWELIKQEETGLSLDFSYDEQRERLLAMRRRSEAQISIRKECRILKLTGRTRNEHRRSHNHWFSTSMQHPSEVVFYQEVLSRLSTSDQATSLFEYEKQWAENAMRLVNMDSWRNDPMAGPSESSRLIELRLEAIDKQLTNNSEDLVFEDGCSGLLTIEDTMSDLLAIEDALSAFRKMEEQKPLRLIAGNKDNDLVDLDNIDTIKERSRQFLSLILPVDRDDDVEEFDTASGF
jgi:hypothetical protein